jgi:hypothetical protein
MKIIYIPLIFIIILSNSFFSKSQKSDLLEQRIITLERDSSNRTAHVDSSNKSYQDFNEAQDSLIGTIKSVTRFFSDMDNLSSVMEMIPAETEVRILKETGDYYLIQYDSIYGFVYRSKVSVPKLEYTVSPGANESGNQEIVNQGEWQQQRYDYLFDKYGKETADKLFANKIWRGMETKMVLDSWGRPKKINRYINPLYIKETWYYPSIFLVFVDGTLEDWEIIQ